MNLQIHNNSIHNNTSEGIKSLTYGSIIRDNIVVDNNGWGIWLDGTSFDHPDNEVVNNTLLRNDDGIQLDGQDANLFDNTISDNDRYGIYITQSTNIYLWNNTLSNNDEEDISLTTSSTAYSIGNTFSTIEVSSDSILTIKSYIDIDVSDASGDNMSGIDIKVMENDVQKYATSYFGGSDSKTDSSGTIATFLINSKKYDGSSTSEVIPTYVSARYYDWVETTSFDASSTIQITVPDLRVYIVGSNDDKPEYYHIQTAIDEADEGETIRAWNGTYLENIEIDEELTIIGNGTSTIINGGNDTAIDVTEDSVTIKNLMIIYSEKGIYVNSTEDTVVTSIKFTTSEYAVYSKDSQNLIVQ